MQHHILVPLDGSTFSEAILPQAATFAHATESALILFQVLEPVYEPIYGALGVSEQQQKEQLGRMRDAQLASIDDYLLNIARQLRAEGLEVNTEVVEGNDPATCIVLRAEQDPSLLLIGMATHGRSYMLRRLFGSVTAKVLQLAPTSLLLLRPHQNSTRFSSTTPKGALYQTVIVPLDGSSFAEQALEQAYLFAAAMNAMLLLISILSPPNDIAVPRDKESVLLMRALLEIETERRTCYLEQRAEQLRKQGLAVQTHVASGHPAEEILRLNTQHQPALLVMTTHGRSGLQRLLLGSVAMKIVQGVYGPMLLVRGRPEEKKSRMGVGIEHRHQL